MRAMGSLYGYEIETDLPLERLNEARGERGTLALLAAETALPIPAGEPAAVQKTDDGQVLYVTYEVERGCLMTMPPSGSFLIDAGAGIVRADAREHDELIEHRLGSTAAATLLAMRGDLALHAAAIEAAPGEAVIFCGPSHRGKSTIARALAAAGHPVLAEDGLIVALGEEPIAYPGLRGIRVRDENGRVTLDTETGPRDAGPCGVAALILLDERGQELSVTRLGAAEAMARFTSSLIHPGGRAGISVAFANLAQLFHTVPPVVASMPDDLDALPRAGEELLDSVIVAQ
jgi:hypothetical protein